MDQSDEKSDPNIRVLLAVSLTPAEKLYAGRLTADIMRLAMDKARTLPADVRAFAIIAALAQATDMLNESPASFGESMQPGPVRFPSDPPA